MARRMSKASKRRLTVFGTLSLIAIIYFGFSLLYNAYKIYSLNIEKNNLEQKYTKLQEEAESLKTDIEKLKDQEYLANYARETYLYSKDGEYIIQLEELEETNENIDKVKEMLDSITSNINENYIILALSFIMVLIFIYIFKKGRKKKK